MQGAGTVWLSCPPFDRDGSHVEVTMEWLLVIGQVAELCLFHREGSAIDVATQLW